MTSPDDRITDGLRTLATLPPGEAAFRLEGEYWTLAYEGQVLRLRDAKGLRYLAELLRNLGRELHAVALLTSAGGEGANAQPASPEVALDPASTERARSAVGKRIRDAIARITAHHPSFGHHLKTCVGTGALCVYRPNAIRPVKWML